MITQTQTQKKMFYCPTAKKRVPTENCPEACYACNPQIRAGEETYHWSG